jgi:hypothetical protein
MARQRKTIPVRGNDESLLLRSAESLGRLIGTLQRELEAARQFTARKVGAGARGNGQAPARQRAAKSTSAATTRKTAAATGRTAAATSKANMRARGGAKQSAAARQSAAKAGVRSKQQRNRRARKAAK